jgi:hypothetical protein
MRKHVPYRLNGERNDAIAGQPHGPSSRACYGRKRSGKHNTDEPAGFVEARAHDDVVRLAAARAAENCGQHSHGRRVSRLAQQRGR